jgi:hypothetical protein
LSLGLFVSLVSVLAFAGRSPLDQLTEQSRGVLLELKKTPTLAAGLEEVRKFKAYLETDAEKLKDPNVDQNRLLRFSLENLREFFGMIHDKDFKKERCGQYREEIMFSLSPREGKPDFIPPEAKDALEAIDTLCAKSNG